MQSAKPSVRDLGILLVIPVLSLGLAVTACSSGGSKGNSASSVTNAAFVTQADTVCKDGNDQLGKAAQQTFGNQQPTADRWRPFMVDTAVPIIERRLAALKALTPPAGAASSVSAIVAAGEAAVAAAKANPQVLSPDSRAPFAQFDDLANAYGIGICAVGG